MNDPNETKKESERQVESEVDVMEVLQQPNPHAEDARKVLGDPWIAAEGKPLSDAEIVNRLAMCRWRIGS